MTHKKIIIVDDSLAIRWIVKAALAPAQFDTIEARDGMDGLEKLHQNQDAALMICDVNMPRMNGLDMIEAVRRDPTYEKLPLLMVTTEGQAKKIDRARKAQAQAWIVKPFRPHVLLAAVTRLIGSQ